jgi:hypothetical protein
MKKRFGAIGAMAAAIAMAGAPAVGTTSQGQSQNQHQQKRDAVVANPTTVRQGRKTALNPTGGFEPIFFNSGMSPKQYGQWLQQTGRQKWQRSKK